MKRNYFVSRRKRKQKKDFRRGIYILPNLFTTCSLFCGFYAVIASFNGDFVRAAWAIMFSAAFDWLDGNKLMITAKYEGKTYCHVLFTVGKDNYVRLGKGLLDYDGHGTFSPDGKWMITETYPDNESQEQKLYFLIWLLTRTNH